MPAAIEAPSRKKFSKSDLIIEIDGKKFHMGYSRLNTLMTCPRQYYFGYVKKHRGPSNDAIKRGQAFHATVEVLGREKMETGEMYPHRRSIKLAKYYAEQEDLAPSGVESVQRAIDFWWNERYGSYNPIAVECDFTINRGGVKLTGRIDFIEDGWVGDHKLSFDTWAPSRAQYGCQPVIYQWAALDQLEGELDFEYRGFRYEITRTIPTPLTQDINIKRIKQDRSDWWEEQINNWAKLVSAGIFPAIPKSENCTRCFHKDLCNPVVYRTKVSERGLRDEYEED